MMKSNRIRLISIKMIGVVILSCLLACSGFAKDSEKKGGKGPEKNRRRSNTSGIFQTDVPLQKMNLILARPEKDSIVASILPFVPAKIVIEFGKKEEQLSAKRELDEVEVGKPVEVILAPLVPDSDYIYRLTMSSPDNEQILERVCGSFHTCRGSESDFNFTITADSHLDERTDIDFYNRTLRNISSLGADFNIDLGDTFMNDKKPDERTMLIKQYLAQRYYFGLIGETVPLFLVIGNHDGESVREYNGTEDCLAVWSNITRKRFFPNPRPDKFYSGNSKEDLFAGYLEDYYSWEWGGVQFIVLNPYWYSEKQRGGDDNWKMSLGDDQYHWLEKTLANSNARFRFVFIHQLVGGLEKPGRGGKQAVPFYEWGGKNSDGTEGFQSRRADWKAPIHQLLLKYKVSAVFHGHDHLFAHEEIDGVIYQEVPQPGFSGRFKPDKALEAGYIDGKVLGGAGFLNVKIRGDQATVEFIETGTSDSEVVYSYRLSACKKTIKTMD